MIHIMIRDLLVLKYIRNPCKKCLVQPACTEKCYKFKIHLNSKDTLRATFLAGSLTGVTLLGSYIVTRWIK